MKRTTRPIDMALESAALVMQSGGSTIAAERSFRNVLSGFNEKEVSAVWRLDFVAARGGAETDSSMVLRILGPIGVNLTQASAIDVLAERVAKGDVTRADFASEIDRIMQLPAPHSRPLTIVAAAVVGAAFSQIAGGDWGSLPVAALAVATGQVLRSELQARKYTAIAVTLICGVLSASIGSVGLRLGFSQIPVATLVGSVIYLAPGLPLINGFVDIVSHKFLYVGVQRIANAMLLFLILAIAIVFASKVMV